MLQAAMTFVRRAFFTALALASLGILPKVTAQLAADSYRQQQHMMSLQSFNRLLERGGKHRH